MKDEIHTENTGSTTAEANSLLFQNGTNQPLVEDLVFENKTINALIKGLEEDLETFKRANEGKGSAPDIVRFSMQLNILKDKKQRNLAAINALIKNHTSESVDTV